MSSGQIHFEKEPLFSLSDPPQRDKYGTEVYPTPFFWLSEFLKYALIIALLYWFLK